MKVDGKRRNAELIQSGQGVLGIEMGSTRIKAVLIGADNMPLASGGHGWENSLQDGIWTYPLEEVIDVIRKWNFHGQRRVSFEYIVFSGINDTPRHVKELARLLGGIRCRINLIRFHPVPGTPLPATDETSIQEFKDALNSKGILTTIRASRGMDIYAACGLLSTKALASRET